MKILAVETATDACSAALLWGGEIRLRYQVLPRGHTDLVLGMLDELLAEAGIRPPDLDAVAFGRGPGSFTGVRIAAGVAQGAAFGAGLPVVPVSTLAALAQRAYREWGAQRVAAAFDARMQEVYWGCYQLDGQGLMAETLGEQVAAPDQVTPPEGAGWLGAGSGWAVHGALLTRRLEACLSGVTPDLLCSAEDIARLGAAGFECGRALPPEQAAPVYLRNQVAKKPSRVSGI